MQNILCLRLWRSRVACALTVLLPMGTRALATEGLESQKAKQCAKKLSIAILGTAPDDGLLASQNPQSQVDQMLSSGVFRERFARFINSKFNDERGANPAEDASYLMTKYILENNLKWKDMFVGQYTIRSTGMGATSTTAVASDPNGLGYFRSPAWLARYAGNELQGIKIATIYRMMNNVAGLNLSAVTTAPGADISANGRKSAACSVCHYDNWYALDVNAALLDRRVVPATTPPQYVPADGQPKKVLDGQMLRNDKEFVEALVESTNFTFYGCRLAVAYLYGRAENACESAVFDKCFEAFKASGSIVNALATVAKDPSYCQ